MIALMQNLGLISAWSDAQSDTTCPVYRDGSIERTDEGKSSIIPPIGGEISHQYRKFTRQLLGGSRQNNHVVASSGDASELGCKAWDNSTPTPSRKLPHLCLNYFWELSQQADSLKILRLNLPKVCFSH
ncbi:MULTISPECIES: hypothetical protein [unclassified Anabaena]|uniref:hypothetical protein n=1 Tax=unclassified Anabaena TaxID=2619674 RepID=UPI000A739370|nr:MULTISPECIES: hypothetical protein [unclassified Anabaena]